MSIEEKICLDLRRWVNHTKEGARRSENDLVYYDHMWNMIQNVITGWEKSSNVEERDFVSMVKYVGPLYRLHKRYEKNEPRYGIKETSHFVSWTKNINLTDIYWVYEGCQYLKLEADAKPNYFGIDLVGLNDYIQKYWCTNFSIGTPAILNEQEVVFPIDFKSINNIKIVTL